MKTKLLIIGLGVMMACNANAGPKKVAKTDWNLSRADWNGAVSYYTYGSDQTYFGEQVYYGDEDLYPKVANVLRDKYDVELRSVMGMCSKSGGVIGSYVKDGKQPKSNKNGDFCWCGLTTTDGYTPWFLTGAIHGTSDFIKSNCARNCAYTCTKYLYDYLYPQDGLWITNAQEMIEYTINLKNN